MPVPGDPHDDVLRPLYDAARAGLPAGAAWWDAHTHVGDADPDGLTATAGEIVAGLDRAGHAGALVFPMHEPEGYRGPGGPNDRVLAAAAASEGRLVALARVDPADGAAAEARRCLEAGAAGIKLHPRSERFGLPHPAVEEVVALAHEARAIVLMHAGRGIPNLGTAAVDLARRHPGARIVLAHAAISDLNWLVEPARELANLFFDTSWWQVWDMLHLLSCIPPARILYASDMPYGSGATGGLILLRAALAVGLEGDALAGMVGGQLARLLAGDDPVDLGPAPGPPRLEPRRLEYERAVAYLTAAAQATFRGGEATEAIALARLACQSPDGEPVLATVDALAARAQAEREAAADEDRRWPGVEALIAAQMVAGTPQVGV